MIDPKVVELAPFDRIPHMLLPVVTDMKQASNGAQVGRRRDGAALPALRRRRHEEHRARTTGGSSASRAARRRTPTRRSSSPRDHNGLPDEIPPEKASDEGGPPLPEKLPLIVIVVDEFADLMMQQGKEVEAAVARLAQKARAAGMHVILATQRPSVDVITGMIKANFPTRIAYRVAQKVDSRTILDEQGAEHLLGMRRHAHQAQRHERDEARAVPMGERGGGPAGDRLPAHAGRARLRRQHPAARATTRRGAPTPRRTRSRIRCTTTPCAWSPTRAAARRRGSSESWASATTAPRASWR